MPYSDNLYSAVDGGADIVPTDDASSQQRSNDPSLTPQNQPWLSFGGSADAHTHDDAVGFGEAADAEDPNLLSPTDGYFGGATGPSFGAGPPLRSDVLGVPSVPVEDMPEGKAKEAEHERLRNAQGLSNSAGWHTAAYTSHPMTDSRDESNLAYARPLTQHRTGSESQSAGAAYHNPASSNLLDSALMPLSSTPDRSGRAARNDYRLLSLPNEAPPAYTASPTSASSPQSGYTPFNDYHTFPRATHTSANMGRPEETQRLLAYQPESMGDRGCPSARRAASHRRSRARQCLTTLLAFLLFVAIIGFPVKLRISGISDHAKFPNKPNHQPDMNYPDIDGDSGGSSICKDAKVTLPTQSFDILFDGDKPLSFVEKMSDDHRHHWREARVHGAVILRKAGPGTPASAVTLEVAVNDGRINIDTFWDSAEQALVVRIPHIHDWDRNWWPCININATVWVPEDGKLTNLDVDALHLDIKLLDNLSLSVSQQTKLASTAGTIVSASTESIAAQDDDDKTIDLSSPNPLSFGFQSPITEVKTVSGDIKGTWPLHNYLGLQSVSGNIGVSIDPQPEPDTAADAPPNPAILYIKSTSGNVDFREPIHATVPPREYRVDVHTTSGNIAGEAAFSTSANFKSVSGKSRLELLPVLDVALAGGGGDGGGSAEGRRVELQTVSTSGDADVSVLEPVWYSSAAAAADANDSSAGDRFVSQEDDTPPPLRCLHGAHRTTSGSVRLRYPPSWEGDIALTSLSGSLRVGGEGVRVINKRNMADGSGGDAWPGESAIAARKRVLARKGEDGVSGGRIAVQSLSGDLSVWIGEE